MHFAPDWNRHGKARANTAVYYIKAELLFIDEYGRHTHATACFTKYISMKLTPSLDDKRTSAYLCTWR